MISAVPPAKITLYINLCHFQIPLVHICQQCYINVSNIMIKLHMNFDFSFLFFLGLFSALQFCFQWITLSIMQIAFKMSNIYLHLLFYVPLVRRVTKLKFVAIVDSTLDAKQAFEMIYMDLSLLLCAKYTVNVR